MESFQQERVKITESEFAFNELPYVVFLSIVLEQVLSTPTRSLYRIVNNREAGEKV